jgi:hypothetical protein
MTELPVEYDLRDALAVDPSPQFAARVRARIAEEPARIDRRFGLWLWMPVAAGAVAAVAVALLVWPARTHVAPLLAARSFGADAATLPSAATSMASVQTPRIAIAPGTERRADPEILISPSESRALLKIIAGPRTWQLDPAPVPVSTAPPVADLMIEPIVITPLSADGGQGVRQ